MTGGLWADTDRCGVALETMRGIRNFIVYEMEKE